MSLYQEGFVTSKSVVSGVSLPNSESQRFLDLLELASGKKPASGHSFLKDRIYSLTKRCTRNKYRSHHGSYFGGLGVKNVVKKVETRYKDAKKETSEKKSNSKANLQLTNSPISYVNKNLRIKDASSEINLEITDTPSEAKSLKFNLKSAALSLMQKLRESGNSKPHEKVIKKAKMETVTKEGAILEEYFLHPDSSKGNSSVPYCFRGTGTFVVTGSRGMRYDFSDQDNSFDEYISSFDSTDNIENTSNSSPVLKRKNSRKQNNTVNSSNGSINFQDPMHSATGFPNHTSSVTLCSCSDKEIDSHNDKIFIKERLPLISNRNFISSKSYCINYPKESNTSTASISCNDSSTEKHINIMDLSASCKVTKDIPNGQFEFSDAKEDHNIYESKFYTVIDCSHYPNPKFCPTSPQQPNPQFCPTSAHNLDDSSNSLTNGVEIKNEYLKKTYYLHEFTSQNSTSDEKSPVTKNKTDSVEQEQTVVSFENCTPPLSVMAVTKPVLKSYARKSQPTNLSKGNLDKCISRSSTGYAPESSEFIASSPSIKVSRKEDSSLKSNYKVKLSRNKKIRDALRFNSSKSRDHKLIQEQGLHEYLASNENNYMKFKDFENYPGAHILNRNNNSDFLCKEGKSIHNFTFLQDANKFPENTASDNQSKNEILRSNTHQMCCQELANNKNRFDETESEMKNIQNRIENSSTELPNKVRETKLKENPSKKIKNKNSETHLATKVAKLQLNPKNENLGGHEGHEDIRQETSLHETENIFINKTPPTAIPAEQILPNNAENKKVETLLAEVTALVSQLNDKTNLHSDNITKPKRYSARFSTANTEKFMTTNVEFRRAQLSKNSQSLPMIRNDYTPEICKETLNVELSKPENIHSTGVSLTRSANENSYKKGHHKALINKKDFPITSDHSTLTASASYDNVVVPVISEPNYNSKNIENPNRLLISTKVIGSLIHCESSPSGRKSSSFLPEFSEGNLKENLKNSLNQSSANTTSCSTNWNSSKAHVFKSSAKFIVKSPTDKVQNFAGLSSVIDRFETNKRAKTKESAVSVDQIPEIKEHDPKFRISELKQCVTNVKNGISFTQTLKEVQKLMQKEKSNTIQDGHVQSKANDYLKAVQRSFGSTDTTDMQIIKNKLKINSQLQSNATSDFIHRHIKESTFEQKVVYGTSKCLEPIQHSKEYIEEKLVKYCEKHENKIELNKQPEFNEGVDCPCEAKSAVFLSEMSATEFQENNIESVNREIGERL